MTETWSRNGSAASIVLTETVAVPGPTVRTTTHPLCVVTSVADALELRRLSRRTGPAALPRVTATSISVASTTSTTTSALSRLATMLPAPASSCISTRPVSVWPGGVAIVPVTTDWSIDPPAFGCRRYPIETPIKQARRQRQPLCRPGGRRVRVGTVGRMICLNGGWGRVRQRAVDPRSELRRRLHLFQRVQLLGDRRDLALDFPRFGVFGEVGLELRQLLRVDRAVNTGPQEGLEAFGIHGANPRSVRITRSRCRAVKSRDLTVFSGISRSSPISRYEKPSRCLSTITVR